MLKVRLLRRRSPAGSFLCGYAVEGHAGFADYGQDIVCAGVSAIAQAVLFGLQDLLGDAVRSEMCEGYLKVLVNGDLACKEGPRAVLRTLELGLGAVQRSYPGTMEIGEDFESHS